MKAEMQEMLTWLHACWEKMLDDPSCVVGNTWDEKVQNLIRPHIPEGWVCHLASHFDRTHARRFHLCFLPVGCPAPLDFDIRFASAT